MSDALEKKGSGITTRKLLAVAPEYRFALYKQILAKRRNKGLKKGSPVVSGSFENGKKR